MRVISGSAKGRKLRTIEGMDTRPTADRVKEGLFSALHFRLPAARVLDLFAGSGQLGIEALSRGAGYCVFVDSSRICTDVEIENLKTCGFFSQSRVVCMDVFSFLVAKGDKFDIIVVDPPYRIEDPTVLAAAAAARLADGGVLAFESSVDNPPAEQVGGLRLYRRYRYGKTFITVYEKDGEVEA